MTTHDRPVALVTGASRGIGRCAAIALARAGCDVVISARTVHEGEGRADTASGSVVLPGSLETTAAEITAAGAGVQAVAMDLLDRASVEEVAAAATACWGRLDVLVNNAIYQGPGPMERLAELSIADAETTMRADYLHQLLLIQRVLPAMLAGGGGSIVNMSSGTAYLDPPAPTGHGGWGIAYAAAKAALTRIVPILHVEHGGDGIRAFNVDPGFVVNERMRATAGSRAVHRRRIPRRTARGPRRRGGLVGHRPGGRQSTPGPWCTAQKLCREHGLVPGWPAPPYDADPVRTATTTWRGLLGVTVGRPVTGARRGRDCGGRNPPGPRRSRCTRPASPASPRAGGCGWPRTCTRRRCPRRRWTGRAPSSSGRPSPPLCWFG